MNKLQRVSQYFNINHETFQKYGIFDAIVGVDSLFFIDPLLLSKSSVPELNNSLEEIRDYFRKIIVLIKSNNNQAYKKAIKKLTLREIKGVGIGYGNSSDDGSAIGPELAKNLACTAKELINMGIDDPAIFEVMGLFEENYGPDRLSDALICILQDRFFQFTERISKELNIERKIKIEKYERVYNLPKHPLENKPLIFIPSDILRKIPVAVSFSDISVLAAFNEDLRERFNNLISPCFSGKKPNKETIKNFFLSSTERMETLVGSYIELNPDHYDFEKDPDGLYSWLEQARMIVKNLSIKVTTPENYNELLNVVKKIINSFKSSIEVNGCWRLLYNNSGKPLDEKHARLFFYGIARIACESTNIDISPESNAGRGPVDFKLSAGKNKIIVEIKLSKGKVKQGYEKQTRIYQESEGADKSYYIVIKITNSCLALTEILKLQKEEVKKNIAHPEIIVIDGLKKKPASKS
ncbi:MAG: hypothetical protein WCV92_02335 [Candidatus Buchananbacteria bacterium]